MRGEDATGGRAEPIAHSEDPMVLVVVEATALCAPDGSALPHWHAEGGVPLRARFAGAVRVGSMLSVSGRSGVHERGEPMVDIVHQTREVMCRIGTLLSELGASYADAGKLDRVRPYCSFGRGQCLRPRPLGNGHHARRGPNGTHPGVPYLRADTPAGSVGQRCRHRPGCEFPHPEVLGSWS